MLILVFVRAYGMINKVCKGVGCDINCDTRRFMCNNKSHYKKGKTHILINTANLHYSDLKQKYKINM